MTPVRAVFFDALGTLVMLEPPAPRLRAALLGVGGVDVGRAAAERAFEAEIAYYLDHHTDGADAAGLADLHDRCARVLWEALGASELSPRVVRTAMLASLSFTPFEDAKPALAGLRGRGMRLVAVSNWDCSLEQRLGCAGFASLLDGAISSAEVGAPKPAAAVFEAALELAGVTAGEALHVGDTVATDVEGARGAGIRAVLLVRSGPREPADFEQVSSLGQVASLV